MSEQSLAEKTVKIEKAIQKLIPHLNKNFVSWIGAIRNRDDSDKSCRDKQVQEYADGFKVTAGKKYVKIFNRNSIWGFVVIDNQTVLCKTSGSYFLAGDLLKAATLNQPTTNFSRGNLLTGKVDENGTREPTAYPDYRPCWTGAV